MSRSNRPWPTLTSDEAAETFVAESDLSAFDWSAAEPVHHEFEDKSARVNIRMLEAIKAEARKRGIKYQRFMRELLDRGMQTLR
ncbi:CopG family antitoxin [Hoeflea ulvae]|uniref:BrnA antitoxin family protein n=1 Tax=Hoeflea ulvae TaxID=2983764 RepID=A0ABT3YEL0_9HYPH|nr:CopG family antitoxin [Hoeflea ulvae]MCY0094329.1 BrnA antitoxin family protein [Hoeflea ulvae]